MTPYKEEDSPPRKKKKESKEEKKERRRRVAKSALVYMEQEVSLGAMGRMDVKRNGEERPWRKLRIKKTVDEEEEERKAAFLRKVAKDLKEKGVLDKMEEDVRRKEQEEDMVFGPALPGNVKAPVKAETITSKSSKEGEQQKLVLRQCTAELPSGSRPDRSDMESSHSWSFRCLIVL